MGKKCAIVGCKTKYEKNRGKKKKLVCEEERDITPVFRFPKKSDELEKWKRALPKSNIKIGPNTVICEKHWEPGYEKKPVQGGGNRPTLPPPFSRMYLPAISRPK